MENLDYEKVSQMLFSGENDLGKTASEKFSDEIRNQIFSLRNERLKRLKPEMGVELDAEAKCREIGDFIKNHVLSVGKEQAVRDFQAGINFLHIDLKRFIKGV